MDYIFLHQDTRKVYKDSIVSVKGVAFEVPSILIGNKVTILYDPRPPILRILIRLDGKDYGEAKPVDIYANRKIKRNKDFSGEIEIISSENKPEQIRGIMI